MNLNNIMSKKIISCNKDCSIYEASLIMKQNNIGFLPIVDQGKIVGIITDRDIVVDMLANKENSHAKIINYANQNIVSVDINSNIKEVLKKMADHQIKRILVVENHNVKGILSISDILNSTIDSKLIYESLKKIFMNHKIANNKVQIDDFYL